MTNINVVENKISSVKKYLKTLERYKSYLRNEIEENIDVRGALERYLYLVVQAAIDLAEAFIAAKGFRKPTTQRECFDILQEEKIISLELAEKLVKMVGFRNVVAHDYEKINYDVVFDILQNRLIDIEEFVEIIEAK